MKKHYLFLFIIFGLTLVSITSVVAHVPLDPGESEALADAPEITDPTKSWVLYGDLHEGGEAHYYQFNATTGMRIRFTLFIPLDERDHDFIPGIVLIGPGLNTSTAVPEYIEIPTGSNATVYPGMLSETPVYEPFSPSIYYLVVDVNINAPASGTYYLAVYDDDHGGRYGMAIGYLESFTPLEWISVPLSVLQIYLWEGQLITLIFLPLLLTFIVGIIFDFRRYKYYTPQTGILTSGRIAGWLYFGSAVSFLYQTTSKIILGPIDPFGLVSLVFVAIPAFLGWRIHQLFREPNISDFRSIRGKLALYGLLGLFGWSGFAQISVQ